MERRWGLSAGVAALILGAPTALLYGTNLGAPLVFDSASWFSATHLPALRDLMTMDRVISRQLAYWLYQMDGGQMAVYRVVHLGLHVAVACLLFLLFRRLISVALLPAPTAAPAVTSGRALAVALLFALHPVQVYAVGDPGQMELVLATLLSVLLLLLYTTALLRTSGTLLLASNLLYPVALLSKENVIAVPAVAAAVTLLVRRPSWPLIRQVAPWFGIAGLVAVLVIAGEAVQPHEPRGLGKPPATGIEAAARSADVGHVQLRSAITQGHLFFRYLLIWLLPHPGWMSMDVHLPQAAGLFVWPQTAGFAAFCALPIAAGWLLLRGGRVGLVGFGLLWPWLLFLPELVAPRITEPFVLYRSYPWIAGPVAAVVVLVGPRLGRAALPLLCAASIGLGGVVYERLLVFRSAYAVWDDAVRKNRAVEQRAPGAFRPYLNRGQALLQLGRVDAALEDFAVALELRPGLAYAYFNRAIAYVRKGWYEQALAAFEEGFACAADPGVTLARAHSNRAGLYLRLGRSEDALADLRRAAALDPARAEYRRNIELLTSEIQRRDGSAPRR